MFCNGVIRIRKIFYCITGIGAVILLISMALIHSYGKRDNVTFTEDVAVVLGSTLNGEEVTLTLSHRLDKAVEYSGKNPKALIVVSGGQGANEDIPEALAMERYLLAKGIPEEKIIKEDQSTSTYENFLFSKKILDEYFEYTYKIAIITNDFHIYRASRLAERLGLQATHLHGRLEWYSAPYNYSRECAAIIKMWLLGR